MQLFGKQAQYSENSLLTGVGITSFQAPIMITVQMFHGRSRSKNCCALSFKSLVPSASHFLVAVPMDVDVFCSSWKLPS